jgi:hypothetical protein
MELHWSKVNRAYAFSPDPNKPSDSEKDPRDVDDTPETPLDEPRPPRVQDPPPQPDQKGPYVVQAQYR